jgi:hypothetical protein
MGAYALAAALAVAALALVLWLGDPAPERCQVELAVGRGWTSAVLDDGRSMRTVAPGERIEVPPGAYRLTLFGDAGRSEQRELAVSGALTTVR